MFTSKILRDKISNLMINQKALEKQGKKPPRKRVENINKVNTKINEKITNDQLNGKSFSQKRLTILTNI